MIIGVLKEGAVNENRVALIPAHVSELLKINADVMVERGAGAAAGFSDAEYQEKQCRLAAREDILSKADILLAVRAAAANTKTGEADIRALKEGATVIATMEPYAKHAAFTVMAQRKHRAFALEKLPRITRAQSMDVLSSQANLVGYKAVLIAAARLPRMFPMMMTAAGTIVPTKVFIVGVGVAGLQAIATAKRLGAVVSAYDVRPAVKEQVESLGARFVEMSLPSDGAETSGGYAREMDEDFYKKQRELMKTVVAENDVVITTAAVPGRKSPMLITKDMLEGMKAGSVVVDLAAERGGNCEVTEAGKTITYGGISILGPLNVASDIAFHASQLFSKNITSFLGEILQEGK